MVQKPVYFPFFQSVENQDRKVLNNELIIDENKKKYVMDYEDLNNKINRDTKMMLLCSPHNPVGRVWTEDELKKLADIVVDNDILVFSDEIHADLILNDNVHIPFSSLSEELAQRTITGFSPSKTFNIAGLYASAIVIPNKKIRDKFKSVISKFHLYHTNCFAIEAVEMAYRYGEEWLDELLEYLERNLTLTEKIVSKIPKLEFFYPEGTYLVWLDFRRFNLSHKKIKKIIENRAGILLNDGEMFGENGKKFMRLNIATPYKRLNRALMKMKDVLEDI